MGGSVSIVTAVRNGVDVYLTLRLNGRGVYGLLDTGSDTLVISRRVIQTTQKLFAGKRDGDRPARRSGTHYDAVGARSDRCRGGLRGGE